jgi:DNA-binding NarL/FixJ family response regulator
MSPLTQRQTRITGLAAVGFTNDEIAIQLGLTCEAVRAELEALHRELSRKAGVTPETATYGDTRSTREEAR